ncbi:MAG: potassium channel family protein [Methanoregula sp.]|nr:potassium channel family protein [Methanoregula sp.]
MKTISLRFRIYVSILAAVLFIGMVGLIVIESFSPLDAFYFLIVTIATVGYGDLHPVSPLGKLLVIVIILAGVGCFVGVVANAIEYMIEMRERSRRIEKLNMIIGVFYSEMGTKLIKKVSAIDPDIHAIQSALVVANKWSDNDFLKVHSLLKEHSFRLDSREISLKELHTFLSQYKGFMLTLLENPQLFEHDRFTDLLHAVFHLAEELNARESLIDLPTTDYHHLSGDLTRVYRQLVIEWLDYMQHLKKKYPYLFSLSMRTNPFDTKASVIVRE